MWSNRWAERYRWSDTLYNNWENGIRDLIPKFITYSRYNLRYHILKKGINLIIALPRLIVSSRVLDLWLIYYRGREKTDNFQFIFVLYVRLESMKIRQQNFSRWENEVINKKTLFMTLNNDKFNWVCIYIWKMVVYLRRKLCFRKVFIFFRQIVSHHCCYTCGIILKTNYWFK